MKALNQKTMSVKLSRSNVCDLMIACAWAARDGDGEKWKKLHDILREQVEAFDERSVME